MLQKTNVPLDYKSALQKAEAFCAYQERSQYEVRGKLISLGIYYEELENIILNLIETGFLNEERFANTYARGKMRIKSWGKNKIKQGLKLKQVSPPLIKKALQNLDGDEYLEKLVGLLEKKAPLIKEKVRFKRNYKLCQYAMSRGFEQDLIFYVLNDREL
ncbi:RecX family transcriptional regulator [Pedobacter psychrophilus]|uniref:Regulatory protein RecX n=1 Tax=Pedobacter psychrophilus TaxID=1826909 RepID=A0A179DCL1_9SPHI|nr:regulatory protein RecX [Pedobacter psychrophilus]OAQ38203.1 RecX family transcriptional regulator [Pedobacter psychrophilus]